MNTKIAILYFLDLDLNASRDRFTGWASRPMTKYSPYLLRTFAACMLALPVLWQAPLSTEAQTDLRIGAAPVVDYMDAGFRSWPLTAPPRLHSSFELSDEPRGGPTEELTEAKPIPNPKVQETDKDEPELAKEDQSEVRSEGKRSEEDAEPWFTEKRLQLEAELKDGFALVSEDQEYELKFHVLNQVDFKTFWPSDQDPAAQNGIYIPRMRVDFEGKLTDPFRYEVSLQRSVEGVFDLLDANLDIRFSEGFQIRLGRTIIPYSYTWYDHLEQYFIAPERPLFPLNFGLSRAAGAQIWGQDELRRWQYSIGGYNGRVVGLADDSPTFDAVGYLNLRPFAVSRAGGLLENLNVGGSLVLGEARRPSEPLPGRTSIQASENDEAANAASAVFLELNPEVVGLGDRLIGAIHGAWYYGPFSLEAECNALRNELFNEQNGEFVRLPASGFHVTLASFLTGESVRGRETVQPLRPFDPRCGCTGTGALEVYTRFSYLHIGNELFERGLANAEEWTNEVSMTDVGFNWYLNRYTKFYLDWQHAEFGSPVLVNAAKEKFSRTNDLLWFRCQVYF